MKKLIMICILLSLLTGCKPKHKTVYYETPIKKESYFHKMEDLPDGTTIYRSTANTVFIAVSPSGDVAITCR